MWNTSYSDKVNVYISESLQRNFIPITKTHYAPNEMGLLFRQMKKRGDAYCRRKAGIANTTTSTAYKFIKKDQLQNFEPPCKMCIRSIVAGCWNFFKLNDQRPDIDFTLVKHLYARKEYNCYSVGFLQPYIMHNYLNCKSMTMIDIDWRIQEAHMQLIQLFHNNEFTNSKSFKKSISKLKLSWVAHDNLFYKPDNRASMALLCKKEQRDFCKKQIQLFQKRYINVDRFRLMLSALHDGKYIDKTSHRLKIIYLSNALENSYTTYKQFKQLMKHFFYSFDIGEKAILIHHVGGRAQFGLYEYTRTPSSYWIKKICHDPYTNTAYDTTEEYYTLYLDSLTNTKYRIPTCHALYKKIKQ